MTSDKETQTRFFEHLKISGDHHSLVDEVSEVLSLSKDSAYRRLRGDTLLSFNEISKLSQHFQISLDSYLNLTTSTVVFQSRMISGQFTFHNYFQSISENFSMIAKYPDPRVSVLAKDIPIFHYFQFTELTRFKLFFWLRTIIQEERYQVSTYKPEMIEDELIDVTREIWKKFEKLPSTEIWSDETINITLSQLNYYLESQVMTRAQVEVIIDDLGEMLEHLRLEARLGKKLPLGKGEEYTGVSGEYQLYQNEVEIGDNTVFFSMGDRKITFKTFSMLNILNTSDEKFCSDVEQHLQRIIAKSTPLSLSSERERTRFFNRMERKVSKTLERAKLIEA